MSIDSPQTPILQSLSVVQIKTPCQMDWDLMTGDDQTRHCDHCTKNVYNISEMSEQDAIELINEKEGNVCLRLFKRPDGTVLTSDCPPIKRYFESSGKKNWFQFSMASLMMLVMASAGLCASAPWIGKKLQPIYDSWFGQAPQGQVMGIAVMGDMVVPAPPVNAQANQPLMGKVSLPEN